MHAAMPFSLFLLLLAQQTSSLGPQARRTPHAGYHGQGQTDVRACVEMNQCAVIEHRVDGGAPEI